jgi:hypothetical protein
MCGVACGVCAFSCLDTSGYDEEEGVQQTQQNGNGGDVETGMEAELPSVMKSPRTNSAEPLVVHLPPPTAAPVATGTSEHTEAAVTVTHIDADID